MQIRIRENSWLAKIAAAKLRSPQVAMVLGSTIHLYGTKTADFLNDKAWVCHELKHVQQIRSGKDTGITGLSRKRGLPSRTGDYYSCLRSDDPFHFAERIFLFDGGLNYQSSIG